MRKTILARLLSTFINREIEENNFMNMLEDDYYASDYNLLMSIRNKQALKVCHIDIDRHGVSYENMFNVGSIEKNEAKRIRIYRRVRKKNSYMNYPFYSNKK